MNELTTLLFQMDLKNFLIVLFTLFGAIVFVFELSKKIFKIFGIEFSWMRKREKEINTISTIEKEVNLLEGKEQKLESVLKDIVESVGRIDKKIDKLEKQNNEQTQAMIETMADRLNQKCRYYIRVGFIPEDEFGDFSEMFKTYKQIGGNHGVSAKYNYCITNLEIKTDNK